MINESIHKCSTCQCEFSLEDEGGIDGYFGILPMSFCPTCLASIEDMCDQLRMPLDEQLLQLSEECGKKDEKILIQASTILKRMNDD